MSLDEPGGCAVAQPLGNLGQLQADEPDLPGQIGIHKASPHHSLG